MSGQLVSRAGHKKSSETWQSSASEELTLTLVSFSTRFHLQIFRNFTSNRISIWLAAERFRRWSSTCAMSERLQCNSKQQPSQKDANLRQQSSDFHWHVPGWVKKSSNELLIWLSSLCFAGDSGGPLEYLKNNKPYIYGLTSYGLGCGSSLPSIYTRVDQYLDWLSEKMSS